MAHKGHNGKSKRKGTRVQVPWIGSVILVPDIGKGKGKGGDKVIVLVLDHLGVHSKLHDVEVMGTGNQVYIGNNGRLFLHGNDLNLVR